MLDHANRQSLTRFMQPSFLSLLMTFLLIAALSIIAVSPEFYEMIGLDSYFNYLDRNPTGIYGEYIGITNFINSNKFIADAAIFTIWAAVGLIIYNTTLGLIQVGIGTGTFMRDVVESKKRDRYKIVREVCSQLLVRTSAIFGLLIMFNIFIEYVLPQIFLFARNILSSTVFICILWTLGLSLFLLIYVHVIVLLLRLMCLRVRVFFNRYHTLSE